MAALTFTITANATTAAQAVTAAPSVALLSLTRSTGSSIVIEASHNNSVFAPVINDKDLGRIGAYDGVLSIPAIPAGWYIRVKGIGTISGTVAVE